MGAYLGRDAILRACELKTEEVSVPEWADPETGADTVLIRELSGRERDAFEASLAVRRGGKMVPDTANMRAKLAARSIVDPETLRPLFAPEDVDRLGELGAAALDRVFDAASRLSGLNERDLEDLGKTSENGRSGGSTSS